MNTITASHYVRFARFYSRACVCAKLTNRPHEAVVFATKRHSSMMRARFARKLAKIRASR